jgi:hypothetical protein
MIMPSHEVDAWYGNKIEYKKIRALRRAGNNGGLLQK